MFVFLGDNAKSLQTMNQVIAIVFKSYITDLQCYSECPNNSSMH